MSDEKANEKEEEKTAEKSWDEKWARDPVTSVVWAGILVWAGLVLLAGNLGLLEAIIFNGLIFEDWALIFLGAGVIVLLGVLFRLAVPAYRRAVTGSLIFAFILIAIGLGDIIDVGLLWPLIIIAIGVVVLFRGLLR
ncbi:MAG: hypothetical protein P8074_11875 [Anaerolineales bacterium]|jgi:hypothetical protein